MMMSIEKNVGRITTIMKGLEAFARKGDQDPFEKVGVNTFLNEALELSGDRFKYCINCFTCIFLR